MFKSNRFSAVILAGGSSSRMGGISKQHCDVLGIPVAARSMLAFERCPECSEIVVVSRASDFALCEGYAEKYGITKYKKTVTGGETRQQSAYNGSLAISKDADYIAIHDAARCLVLPEDVSRVFKEARKHKCASACTPVTDTIKTLGKNGKTATEGQPDRASLFAVQTPQIFLADLYAAAAHSAMEDGFCGTDDCSLVERVGFGCKLVVCSETNLKITRPSDLIIAEALLKRREETEREKGRES